MSGRRCRPLVLAALLLLLAAPSTAAAASPAVRPSQELAALVRATQAFAAPSRDAASVGYVPARTPLTEGRTVLPVIGRATGSEGVRWLHVRLPGRPNGRTGWIRERGTRASSTRWHLVVRVASRRVVVYRDGRAARTFTAIVGTPSTPTPYGRFYVEEAVALRAWDVGGPFALALSARSNVLQEFAGGPGQIGVHGLANVGGVLGTAASHGCVRLANDVMRWLVDRTGPGTPVTITR